MTAAPALDSAFSRAEDRTADAGRRYRIGRSRGADLILTHPTVSRTHAELVATDDGRYRLIDSGSRFGTHVEEEGRWIEILDVYVEARHALRFGAYATTLGELLKCLPSTALPSETDVAGRTGKDDGEG